MPVDQRDLGFGTLRLADRLQPAEPPADDDHAMEARRLLRSLVMPATIPRDCEGR